MKKTYVLMIMCLLVFSIVPMALADEDSGSTEISSTESSESHDAEVTSVTETHDSEDSTETSDSEDKTKVEDSSDDSTETKRELAKKVRERVNELAKEKENKFREIKKLTTAEQSERIKTMVKEEFRNFQESRLMEAVEKCKEQGFESCEEKLQKRLELVGKLQEKDLERIQKIVEHKSEALKKVKELETDDNFKKYKKENEFKARALTKEKLGNAREKLLKAEERYKAAKENYQEAKDRFEEKKKDQSCDDDDCPELKADAKEVLQHASERVLETLNKLLERVDSAEYFSEEEVANYKTFLEEEITKVEAIMLRVEGFNENTPKEDINAAFAELRKITQDANQAVKRAAGKLVNSRIGGIVISSQQLRVKLNRILERMAEAGKDTSAAEPLIVDFNRHLESAQSNFELAKTEYDAENVQQAHEYMITAKESLKNAQKVLQQIVKSIADNDGTEELEDSELEDIEDSIDDDADEDSVDDDADEDSTVGDEDEDSTSDSSNVAGDAQ